MTSLSKHLMAAALIAGILIGSPFAQAQQVPDPRVADLIQTGKLRVALGLGGVSAMKNPTTGEVHGPAVDLARALAAKIGIQLQPIEYPRPGAVLEGLQDNNWDVTFLVVDPARAAEADFSIPYMQSDYTYLVSAGSSKRSVSEMDQPGLRIAVPRGDSSDLYLSKTLTRAQLVRTDTLAAALDMVRTGQADAYAAPRAVLLVLGTQLAGSRVLDDGFADIAWAAVVPKGKPGRLSYVTEFIEEAKASGLVKQTIDRANLRGLQVAPPGKPN